MLLNIIIALLVLNIMVIAHELGHYLFARRNGIEVDEFAVGFGPTLWKKRWNGTMWLLKLFPLGGYNGLKGEMEAEEGKGNFATAGKKAKFQVLIAGSAMNVLVAIVAFYLAIALYGWKVPIPVNFSPIGGKINEVALEKVTLIAVAPGSPAEKAGIVPPLHIVEINGKAVSAPADVGQHIVDSPTDEVSLLVQVPGGESRVVSVVRDENKRIGVQLQSAALILDYSGSLITKAFAGISHAANVTILTWDMLSLLIGYSQQTGDLEPVGYALAGPVAIVAAVDSVVTVSPTVIADLASMTGLIGISLAIFNLLPFPGLDGWHIFLLFYEKARGRKPNQKLVGLLTGLGLFFLIGLGVAIMIKDVWMFFVR